MSVSQGMWCILQPSFVDPKLEVKKKRRKKSIEKRLVETRCDFRTFESTTRSSEKPRYWLYPSTTATVQKQEYTHIRTYIK